MRTLTIKLPDGLEAKVAALARRRRTSKSDVVRTALERLLASRDAAAAGSPLDVVRDLVGSVSGPKDLSFNKEHLRDFGR